MTKLITVLLFTLMVVTTSAWAEWINIGENGEATIYIDKESIRKEGNLRKVWQFYDLKIKNDKGAMSIRSRIEIDCKNERVRPMSFSAFSEAMLRGTLLAFDDLPDSRWRDAAPNTPAESAVKISCAE